MGTLPLLEIRSLIPRLKPPEGKRKIGDMTLNPDRVCVAVKFSSCPRKTSQFHKIPSLLIPSLFPPKKESESKLHEADVEVGKCSAVQGRRRVRKGILP